MEQLATLSPRNRTFTPQRRKSPGDNLGSGKSQVPITQYFSPSGSSSHKSSPPYSPIACSSAAKRRTSVDSSQPKKKKKRTKAAPLSQKQPIVVLSSEDSSDEVLAHDPRTDAKQLPLAVLSKTRLQFIKRRLYTSDSLPISSGISSSRPKEKLLTQSVTKRRRSRVLSDSESEEDALIKNSQMDPKPLQDVVLQSSQVRRRLCPETSSQAVVITSSDESDFELHNSKQTQSFLSQSVWSDTSQSLQKSFLSSQTNGTGRTKIVGSYYLVGRPTGTQTFLEKRCSLGRSSDSFSPDSKDNHDAKTPILKGCDVNILSDCQESLFESPPLGPSNRRGQDSVDTDTMITSKSVDGYNDGTQVPTPAQNGHLSSIYFQETIPLSFQNDSSSILHETTDDHRKTQLNPGPCRRPAGPGFTDYSRHAIPRSPSPSHPIYSEETIDLRMNTDAALETFDFYDKPLTNGETNTAASTNKFETTVPICTQKGAIIEASDDENEGESIMIQNQSDMEAYEKNRTSLGVIPLSELLDVSHISGSDNSDFHEVIGSDDDDLSIIERSVGTYPEYSDALATHLASLLVEGSDESSTGITPILKSVLDASADFFSDIVSSFGTGGSTTEQDLIEDGNVPGKQDSVRDPSPAEELLNIALAVNGLDSPSATENCLDVASKNADESELQQGLAPDNNDNGATALGVDCHPEMVDLDTSNPPSSVKFDDTPSTITENESLDSKDQDTMPEKASSVSENGENACSLLSVEPLPGVNTNSKTDPSECVAEPDRASSSMLIAEESADADLTSKGVPAETKIVCGSQPPKSSIELHITQHMEKTLLQDSNKPLLLDTVISECQNFAEPVFDQEPLKTFVSQYSNLPRTSKAAFHGCLIDLLEDSNRWLKYADPFAGSIDSLVSSGILEYLNKNDDLITRLNYLTFSEITDVLCKLGNSPSESIETTKNIILNTFSSAYTCERVKEEVTNLINRKFVKLTESASFSIKISLELFLLPLNLCDKFYKPVDVVRFANTLIRDLSLNKFLLLPLKMSKMVVNERVLCDLSALCRLKSELLGSDLNDESIYLRLNDSCSSIAALDISAEVDASIKNCPTYKFLVTNYVHALDEQLKSFLYLNTSDIEFVACIYLGVLLKQNVTGFQHKVKWCREQMKYLLRLFDPSNIFEEFSKTLKEPVSPVEFIVRSEFVSNALKIKKLGLSPDEKSHLTKRLRPISHETTQIRLVPSHSYLNYYSVLTRKPRGKNFYLVRANIFQKYKTDFPCGVEDNGGLLLNAIFLSFWQAIYLKLDGMFVSKFQNGPLDWGSEEFFSRRENFIKSLASEMQKHGLPAVFELIKRISEQFSAHRCVVDWRLVAPNKSTIQSVLEALGIERFLKLSIYVLGKLDERILGFPDIVLWNPESKTVKVLGLKKPSDPLYPYQILWLEKLLEFGVDAEELQIVGNTEAEANCSQIKLNI